MRLQQIGSVLLFIAVASLCKCLAQTGPPITYEAVDLSTLGGNNCNAYALNNHSQIVGGSQTIFGIVHAFLWEQGNIHDLGTLPGNKGSVAYALNNKGQIVGLSDSTLFPSIDSYGFPDDFGAQAVIWNNQVISKLPVASGSQALGISNTGDTVGIREEPIGSFLLQNGKLTDLGSLGGGDSQADAISEAGVAGTSYTKQDKSGASYCHAFLWSHGRMQDLGLKDVTAVNALNDTGQVVGMATVDPTLRPQQQHLEAFVWQNGNAKFLGGLPGSLGNSDACGINKNGLIVGWSHAKAGYAEAVLWNGGHFVDLNLCTNMRGKWTLDSAKAINDQGQILCQGYTMTAETKGKSYAIAQGGEIPGMVRHSFLLTPIAAKP